MAFTSGVIGLIHVGPEELENSQTTEVRGEVEYNVIVKVEGSTVDVFNRTKAKHGILAAEQLVERQEVQIDGDGNIEIGTTNEKGWVISPFWWVPNKFVVIENTLDDRAFHLFSKATGSEISRVRFNLAQIIREHPGQWMGGFHDRPDQVRSGTLYGEEIEEDTDMGEAFMEADKNQIGPKIEFDGVEIKCRITRDGLVQVVAPGNYKRERYLTFIEEILLDYAR